MDNIQPILTVVIPVFNREHKVCATLDTISRQSAKAFKVILVDNASTDNTLSVLDEWAASSPLDVQVLSEPKRGASAARNRGLRAVDTMWTMFFDSDDTMAPGHLQRVLDAIGQNPYAEMIGWDINFHYPARTTPIRKPFIANQYSSLFDGTTGTQRYCARTALFNKAGGWDPEVGVWDDIELGARLLSRHPMVVKLKGAPTVDVYLNDDSLSQGEQAGNIEELDKSLNRIAKTVGKKGCLWVELKRVIIAARSKEPAGRDLYRRIIKRNTFPRSLLYRLAYFYTRNNGRGIAKILRPVL